MATSTFSISCACGQITGSVTVPSSKNPLPIFFCHCSTCRHVTGQLCLSSFAIPASSDSPFKLEIQGQPLIYRTSDSIIRHSCGHCGASIYNHDLIAKTYNIASGVVDKSERVLVFGQHLFVADTKDGGLSSWLKGRTWAGEPERSEEIYLQTNPALDKLPPKAADSRGKLKCYCHCRGVEFEITPPNKSSSKVSAPVSDLIVPYLSDSPQKFASSSWWLRANGTKYFAGTCACNSCRLSAGYDIQAWAFVPKTNIRQMDGKELDYDMGTLKRYSHTQGAYREFCGTCGATVFWHDDERPGVVDVSVGLLDAEEGARAEHWLEWATGRVSFEECAQNKTLVSSVSSGLREWAEALK